VTTSTDAPVRRSRSRRAPDTVLAEAVDIARQAAEEVADRHRDVGDHLEVLAEGERLVSHLFDCLAPGYHGWRWSVTLARAPRSRVATVCEAVLLPGPEAMLAPEWVPWRERLLPGDLGPGDLLPAPPDDERLQPGYAETGEEEADRFAVWELGLGRPRVLSPEGRRSAAQRWYDGDHGPFTAYAQAAPARCSTCGFLTLLAGSLRQAFGVCANEMSPSDGAVVSLDHGCGAHSEAVIERARGIEPLVLDETGLEQVDVRPVGSGGADEDLGHS